ncbi:Uncharacterised protein [Serratia rubidaea]|uniref:Uncharacterized protein n=1 Tax=Serratia rubidaea TaxID=61652 RepID=A0A4U9HHI5_SERRU|nr:Uncharacterised protein [Serratia rubidaea]
MWLPSILTAISGGDILHVSLLALLPLRLGALLIYPWSLWASKNPANRYFLPASASVMAAIGLAGAVAFFQYNLFVSLSFLCLAAVGIYTAVPSFLSMPGQYLLRARRPPPAWRW